MAFNRADEDLGHVAVLQWDYEDAEGYLLESRDGTSGNWNCIVAGTFSSREPSGTSTVSTTKGGAVAASEDGHFRIRHFNSQEFSYAGEATCDDTADYGYIFNTTTRKATTFRRQPPRGQSLYHQRDYSLPSDQVPTGLTVTAGAKHKDVEITGDPPAATSPESPSTANERATPTPQPVPVLGKLSGGKKKQPSSRPSAVSGQREGRPLVRGAPFGCLG